MGRVDCCSLEGLEMVFHSSDHLPPHVHVRKPGHWEIRADLMQTTGDRLVYRAVWPKQGPGPLARDQRRIRKVVAENRGELLEEWDRKVCPR